MGLKPAEDVPAEMWMAIFEELHVPADLYGVLLTCRKFHSYAIRALHRNVVWRSPTHVATNLPLWSAEPRMAADVKSLEIHISTLPEFYNARFVRLDGVMRHPVPGAVNPPHRIEEWPLSKSLSYYRLLEKYIFATRNLYDSMTTRMFTFTFLKSLVFRNLLFTDDLFKLLHSLPSLRSLHIEMCLFPGRSSCEPRDHSVLPITDLTLLNLRRRIQHLHGYDMHDNIGHGHVMADMDDDITHVLRLALAHHLQTLRIDSTADVLGRVYSYWDSATSTQAFRIPAHLRSLYLNRKKIVPTEIQPQFAGEQLFPDRALAALFTRCMNLTKVGLSNTLARYTSLPDGALPFLNAIEGLPEPVMLVVNGGARPIEAISLLWNENSRVTTFNNNNNNNNNNGNGMNGNHVALVVPAWQAPQQGFVPHHHHHHHPLYHQHHFQVGHPQPPPIVVQVQHGGVQAHFGGPAAPPLPDLHQLGGVNGGVGAGAVVGPIIGNGNGGVGGGGGNGNGNGNGNNNVGNTVLDTLLQISRVYPNLRMLAVESWEWEDEILIAACKLFPKLERLKLTYFGCGPSEVCFLCNCPFLSWFDALVDLRRKPQWR